MYQKILNPLNGQWQSVNSKRGKKIIYNYLKALMTGGYPHPRGAAGNFRPQNQGFTSHTVNGGPHPGRNTFNMSMQGTDQYTAQRVAARNAAAKTERRTHSARNPHQQQQQQQYQQQQQHQQQQRHCRQLRPGEQCCC